MTKTGFQVYVPSKSMFLSFCCFWGSKSGPNGESLLSHYFARSMGFSLALEKIESRHKDKVVKSEVCDPHCAISYCFHSPKPSFCTYAFMNVYVCTDGCMSLHKCTFPSDECSRELWLCCLGLGC